MLYDTPIKINDISLQVRIMSTEEEHKKGYSNVLIPPGDTEGMLFEFKESSILYFHMTSVLFPLDIIFFNDKNEYIVHYEMPVIKDNIIVLYNSILRSNRALELKSGFVKRHLDLTESIILYR